ncbi:unnamed protein product [Microthlaspi erraticum]|uniref:Uncharacterized protein n=1 Tax=Microthlaspi erraticum TaxID=1685480 RepID=A0A6D2JMH0_9BRAS|nr:unnamed protein product [Microthlaspi erraticum]
MDRTKQNRMGMNGTRRNETTRNKKQDEVEWKENEWDEEKRDVNEWDGAERDEKKQVEMRSLSNFLKHSVSFCSRLCSVLLVLPSDYSDLLLVHLRSSPPVCSFAISSEYLINAPQMQWKCKMLS